MDGDAAEHRLDDDADALQEGVVQDAGPAGGTQDRKEREDRGQRHHEGEHPVAELDGLVERGCGTGLRDQRTGLTLRPGRAPEARAGDADHGAGKGDTTLADHEDDGVEPLSLDRRYRKPAAQAEDRPVEGENPPVETVAGLRRPFLHSHQRLGHVGRRCAVRRSRRHGFLVCLGRRRHDP